MDAATYAVEAEIEKTHWWFVGRRRLFAREIARLNLRPDAKILDIGTSTGTNLRMLRELGFTNVTGLDASDEAIRFCREKGLGFVQKGDVTALPFADASFDLVLATDIIEHVDDDAQALKEIRRVARPGGFVLITVPAFRSLWGTQDDVAHHKRRYRKPELTGRIAQAGLSAQRVYHFNFLLFVPIWLARQIIRMARISLASENDVNAPGLNGVLTAVFEVDCRLSAVIRPPFGVSILTLAERA